MSMYGSFKESLMAALHSAVKNFNESGDPNAAVIKAAQAHDFNTDQTTRLVETFNTARTIYHYKNAADKTAEFSLADASAVLPALFKQEAAPVAKSAGDLYDYTDYGIKEADYRDQMVVKSASGINDFEISAPTEYNDTSMDTLGSRAQQILRVQRGLADAARDESKLAASKASEILSKTAAAISRGYQEQCQDKYNRLMAGYCTEASPEYKDQFGPVMSKFSEYVPKWLGEAQRGVKVGYAIEDSDLQCYVEPIKEAKYWMEQESEMLAIAGQLDKEADDFEREWMEAAMLSYLSKSSEKAADTMSSMVNVKEGQAVGQVKKQQPASEVMPMFGFNKGEKGDKDKSKPKEVQKQKGVGDALYEGVTGGVSEGIKSPIANFMGENLSKAFTGPGERANKDLSERLKNVQRQIMLEDLMVNDPVLSDENPDNVVQAYNAVLNLAPDLSGNKEIVRAILRQSVHSMAVSPYEAQVWTDLEKSIRTLGGKMDKGKAPEMQGKGGRK